MVFTQKEKAAKAKTNKGDYIKNYRGTTLKTTLNFYTAKETINKMERQLTEWQKILASQIFDKGIISKIYKRLI